MLSFAETKIALVGGLALVGSSLSPEGFEGWTLPSFAVGMVVYLLWKGERHEKQQQKFREDSLKAQIHVKDSIESFYAYTWKYEKRVIVPKPDTN